MRGAVHVAARLERRSAPFPPIVERRYEACWTIADTEGPPAAGAVGLFPVARAEVGVQEIDAAPAMSRRPRH